MTPRIVHANGVQLALWEQPAQGTPMLFTHATGFHGRSWNPIIQQIPRRNCLTVDLRGHGLSSKPRPPYRWHVFGEDVAALTQHLNLRGAIGVGHSMGGHSLAYAAILQPQAFSELILIDPVILPPSYYTGVEREPHFARKRRNRWSSWQEMFDKFVERPPFVQWDRAMLQAYCEFALLAVPGAVPDQGAFQLACPPEIEASVYENSGQHDADLYARLGEVQAQVTIVRCAQLMPLAGPMMMNASPASPDLASRFRHGRDIEVAYSHFIPMEAPGMIADLLRGARA